MTFSDFKRHFFFPAIYSIVFIFISPSLARAADIQAELDSSDGSSGFTIENSSASGKDRIDSNGNVGIGTTTMQTLLDVSPQGMTPLYVGGGDAYIQNNLEVDGTTYLNDVYINGLEVNGLTFTGQPSMDALTVTGSTYLATTSGNVGIGTVGPANFFVVGSSSQFQVNASGAIAAVTGITTTGGYTQSGPGVNTLSGRTTFNANVGIGSTAPGQALDVNGTVRAENLTMSGQSPVSGYVLTASDSAGDTTWSVAGGVAGWTTSGNNVYETGNGNVGIGTTTVNQGALVVTNGNVGIGTWAPTAPLAVGANAFTVNASGVIATSGAYTQSGNNPNSLSGTTTFNASGVSASFASNVGIGSTAPGQALDVNGTVRTENLTMSGQSPISGYVLTAMDSAGEATWSAAGGVAGWTTSGNNVYETGNGNVGIGTTTVNQGALVVTNGNVGIGTWAPTAPLAVGANAFTVNSAGVIATSGAYTQSGNNPNSLSGTTTFNASGVSASFASNVGIGSTAPGQALDVNGTVRTENLTMSGQSPISGYVLTAMDSAGETTWSAAGGVAGWTTSGNNVYETGNGNVGIGTTTVNQGALVVTNGNVGIGTWAPTAPLAVGANAFTVNASGAITTSGAYTQSGNNPNSLSGTTTFSANVGIGSTAPGQALDVKGTVRTINLTMSGQSPVSGYVLTASDSAGDTTWSSAGGVSGWTTSGNNVYETGSGNVGIGTTTVNQGALVVTNGNVGIGTWAPANPLSIVGGASIGSTTYANTPAPVNGIIVSGNVGIGSLHPGEALDVTGTLRDIGQIVNGNVGIGTSALQIALAVSNGNVGIGTWTAANSLSVVGGMGIGSATYANTTAPVNGIIVSGNVGIGSIAPGQALDVTGTVRTIGLTMSGNSPVSGYVLTASDSAGDTTWSSAGGVSGWTTSGNNVYETGSGNVGIGTTTVNQGALVVTNGNVGIGTWAPAGQLDVEGTLSLAIFKGNVGIGTISPSQSFIKMEVAGGGILLSNNYYYSERNNVGASVNLVGIDGGNVAWLHDVTSAQGIAIKSGGSVGIGTSTPSNLFVVAGGGVGIGTNSNSAFIRTSLPVGGLAVEGNVGIGTTALQTAFSIMGGNVGIGTWTAAGGSLIIANGVGNVGIGSTLPGQALDVKGTVRTIGLTMSGNSPVSGYVLTASDSAGDTTWSSAGGVSGWTTSGNNVYETGSGNVGIGTTTVNQGALVVTNGNVGIGTWAPANPLSIVGGASIGSTTYANTTAPVNGIIVSGNVGIGSLHPGEALDVTGTIRDIGQIVNGNVGIGTSALQIALAVSNGNVGIGTWTAANSLSVVGGMGIGSATYANTTAPINGIIVSGNVGIGSIAPGQALDVTGTVRTIGLTMSGQSPVSGYVLTASDSAGDTTWSSAGGVSGWTTSGNNVYETGSGNVGIGTTTVNQGALVVTNGNVGIGTWAPANPLSIVGGASIGSTTYANTPAPVNGIIVSGNVGIGSLHPGEALDVTGTLRDIGQIVNGNVGIGTSALQIALAVSNGNVGIGTWTAANSLSVVGGMGIGSATYANTTAPVNGIIVSGNVGIGSIAPGQALDVTGTVRTIGLTMSGNSPVSGYVLTASDSAGDTTWSSAGGVSGWTTSGNNVYETGSGNVGIGTTTVNQGALVVTNGNVGIGTWAPANSLSIVGGASIGSTTYANTPAPVNGIIVSGNVGIGSLHPGEALDVTGTLRDIGQIVNGNVGIGTSALQIALAVSNGNVGIGTWTAANSLSVVGGMGIGSATYANTTAPINGIIVSGNVGIGSTAPGQALDVTGTTRTQYFTMSGNSPIGGYVLTASDSAGDTTWSSAGGVSGWTTSGNNVYETGSGNVGIGTTTVNQGALVVTNGNVGIGTWSPAAVLQVNGTVNPFVVTSGGNVGVGSLAPGDLFDIKAPSNFVAGTSGNYFQVINNSGVEIAAINSYGNFAYNDGAAAYGSTGTAPKNGSIIVDPGGSQNGVTIFPSVSAYTANYFQVIDYNTDFLDVINPTGNLGIGTQTPVNKLVVNGGVGVGTGYTSSYITTAAPSGGMIVQGNVGLGSLAPGQALDVTGTTRTQYFTMSGNSPIGGYVLTASDSAGDTTWSSAGGVSGWTTSGINVYETNSGNVGIGTTTVNQGALVVTNGNVGIGTWSPAGVLQVNGTVHPFVVTSAGNIGVGSLAPGDLLAIKGPSGFVGGSSGNYFNVVSSTGVQIAEINSYGNFSYQDGAEAYGTVGTNPASGSLLVGPQSAGNGITINQGSSSYTGNFLQVLNNSNAFLDVIGPSGNLGVGTATALNQLTVNGGVGIGTGYTSSYLTTAAPSGGMIVQGNVGIGSLTPGQALDVTGTTRTQYFAMSGNAPVSGEVLTASDSAGDTTWSSAGGVSGWTTSGINVYETNSGNVGIGTTTVNQGALVVTNGNVGIGTWTTAGGKLIIASGNVGIGSLTPGQALDVNGTVRSIGFLTTGSYTQSGGLANTFTGNVGVGSANPGQALDVTGTVRTQYFTMSGNSPIGGYVLTASDSAGDTTWSSAGGVSGWTTSGINVYETNSGNVGIGTTTVNQGALVVTNGNVGIGTWTTAGGRLIIASGNVGIGSLTPGQALDVTGTVRSIGFLTTGSYTQSGGLANTFTGNVGIGSLTPGQALDVTGTTRTQYFAMSGNAPVSGEVLTASDSAGDTTWSSAGGVSGWTTSGVNVYETNSGNVGIGTTIVNQAALTVMNGNVGIGTWAPSAALIVRSGNVGIGTAVPQTYFHVSTNNSGQISLFGDGSAQTQYVGINNSRAQFGYNSVTANAVVQSGTGKGVEFNVNNGSFGSGQAMVINSLANVGIGSVSPNGLLDVEGTLYSTVFNALPGTFNVGIGSFAPGQKLDVTGTVRMTGLTMSGNSPIGGEVLTASDSAGDTTWSSAGGVSGWTTSGINVYETNSGNVGIGSTNPGEALDVQGTVRASYFVGDGSELTGLSGFISGLTPNYVPKAFTSTSITNGDMYDTNGNVGIGSTNPGEVLDVQGTIRASGNVGIGSSITDSSGNARLTITSSTVEISLQ